jgi:hypothetical protein
MCLTRLSTTSHNQGLIIMVKVIQKENKELCQCEECGFHYESRKWAEKCQAWCKERKTCNIEITARAEENKSLGTCAERGAQV